MRRNSAAPTLYKGYKPDCLAKNRTFFTRYVIIIGVKLSLMHIYKQFLMEHTMSSKDHLLDLLEERTTNYKKKTKRCREELSNDAIHDMRTSVRRLLAALEIVAFFTSTSKVEKVADRLKDQMDGFSDLRDMQVMLDKLSDDINILPQLEPFQNYLAKREKRRKSADEKHLQNIKPGGINKRLLKIQKAWEDLSAEEVEGKLPQAVDGAFLTVIQRYSEVNPSQLTTIHRLRVTFKKFRYMVEAIHPCLPNVPESLLRRMDEYQTRLGNIHDIQVFLETVAEFADQDSSYDPTSVRRFYERILDEALTAYLEHKEEVIRFWRATPLEVFPWQAAETRKEEQT